MQLQIANFEAGGSDWRSCRWMATVVVVVLAQAQPAPTKRMIVGSEGQEREAEGGLTGGEEVGLI